MTDPVSDSGHYFVRECHMLIARQLQPRHCQSRAAQVEERVVATVPAPVAVASTSRGREARARSFSRAFAFPSPVRDSIVDTRG